MAEAVLICSPKISYIQQSHCGCSYYLVVWIKSCITIPHRIWYLFWFTTQARGRELGGEVRFGDFQLPFPSMRSFTPHESSANCQLPTLFLWIIHWCMKEITSVWVHRPRGLTVSQSWDKPPFTAKGGHGDTLDLQARMRIRLCAQQSSKI